MSRNFYKSSINRKNYYWKTLLLVFSWIVYQSVPVQAQTKVLIDDKMFEIDARMAIDSLYNRNNDGAWYLMKPWRQSYPDHPIWLLWEGMELWWEVLDDLADTSLDRKFIEKMMEADFEASRLLRREQDHKDALIIKAVSTSYIARLHSNREEWVRSLQVGRAGYQAHLRLVEVAPDLPDNLFAEGMKLYYSAYIPEAYPVVRAVSWFLPEGDKQGGIDTLAEASQKAVFARQEAAYFLGTIYLNYEREFEKAKILYKGLTDRYPNNPYYRRLYLRTLAQLNEYHEMMRFFDETMEHWQKNSLPENKVMEAEIWYWYGRAQYYSGMLGASLESFSRSVALGSKLVNSRERDTHTLAAFFAGRASEQLRQHEEARKYYRIAANQRAVPDASREARQRLRAL